MKGQHGPNWCSINPTDTDIPQFLIVFFCRISNIYVISITIDLWYSFTFFPKPKRGRGLSTISELATGSSYVGPLWDTVQVFLGSFTVAKPVDGSLLNLFSALRKLFCAIRRRRRPHQNRKTVTQHAEAPFITKEERLLTPKCVY